MVNESLLSLSTLILSSLPSDMISNITIKVPTTVPGFPDIEALKVACNNAPSKLPARKGKKPFYSSAQHEEFLWLCAESMQQAVSTKPKEEKKVQFMETISSAFLATFEGDFSAPETNNTRRVSKINV